MLNVEKTHFYEGFLRRAEAGGGGFRSCLQGQEDLGREDLRHKEGKSRDIQVKIGGMKDKEKENAVNEIRILASLNDQYIIGYKDAFFD